MSQSGFFDPSPEEVDLIDKAGVVTKCESCQADIVWAHTEKGKMMPLDAEPSPVGRLRKITIEPDGAPLVHHLTMKEIPTNTARTYVSHFVTCPDADSWRRS
jgi:hypothetical protein